MSQRTAKHNYQQNKDKINALIRNSRIAVEKKLQEQRERLLVKANTKVVPKPSKEELQQLLKESAKTKDVSYYECRSSFKTFSNNWV